MPLTGTGYCPWPVEGIGSDRQVMFTHPQDPRTHDHVNGRFG